MPDPVSGIIAPSDGQCSSEQHEAVAPGFLVHPVLLHESEHCISDDLASGIDGATPTAVL
jgi:hypothetical protein